MVNPTSGDAAVAGPSLPTTDLIALRRHSGYIIQGSGLFPHRTVYENISTIPRLLAWPEEKTRAAAAELMGKLDLPLEKFGDRYPRSLSGGEQQRVGIARAMIARPLLLLCDEPFSALDPLVRHELQEQFVALRDRGGVTMLFVTHDLAEAARVGRRIVLMEGGAIVCDLARDEFL